MSIAFLACQLKHLKDNLFGGEIRNVKTNCKEYSGRQTTVTQINSGKCRPQEDRKVIKIQGDAFFL